MDNLTYLKNAVKARDLDRDVCYKLEDMLSDLQQLQEYLQKERFFDAHRLESLWHNINAGRNDQT